LDNPISYIILINYNNWLDTVICVENLIQNNWKDCKIIIVDNSSNDNSIEKIHDYLNGNIDELIIENYPKRDSLIKINKKVFQEFDHNTPIKLDSELGRISLIKSNINGGFAFGNNLGANLAKADSINESDFLWFLNNDTYTDPKALDTLINFFISDNYGLIGSKIVDYDPPHDVQAIFGKLNKISGNILVHKSANNLQSMDYPIGASLFTNIKIFYSLHKFDESYFLYHEEIDFSTKAIQNNYKIGVALDSIIYHKQGATTGSKKKKKKNNLDIESFKYKGFLLFYKKFHPHLILFAYVNLFLKSIKQLLKRDLKHSRLIIGIIIKSIKS
jgi:GT2 family glycosyltransferase